MTTDPIVIPPVVTPPATIPPVTTSPNDTPNLVTSLKIQNLSTAQSNVPVSFGQVFAKGDLPANSSLRAQLNDGTALPIQVDAKATHDDGSLRHAVISANLPQLGANITETVKLIKNSAATPVAVAATPGALLAAGFTAGINITLNGQTYSASADSLLKSGKYSNWLAGAIVNEWQVSAPLKNTQGVEHPHLTARFAIRSYAGQNKARVDVTLENNWAYEPGPQNFTYDAQVQVGSQTVYSKLGLTHYHHARWRKVFWWGAEPQIHIQHNTAYLIASKAVPNYDQSIVFTAASITPIKTKFTGAVTEPMGSGMALPYMPNTGGRPDIGLLPGWAATYLLTMDKDAKQATLGSADLAGSWSMHYRDKNTDRPISLADYPYMTILGTPFDTINPTTKKSESFPACGGGCTNPNTADTAHEPSFSYLPYLVTGDYYHLEELQFWTMWNLFQSNPEYRNNIKGLFHSSQLRAQAWILRTLADVAYITPNNDALKTQFTTFLSDNLDWYNKTYIIDSISSNALGAVLDGGSVIYNDWRGIAPWQDDFFTSAVGHAMELGFIKAGPLLSWKAKFPTSRMIDPGYCWVIGSIYSLNVRDSASSSYYTTMNQAYKASISSSLAALTCASADMATNLGLKIGEMIGYSDVGIGFPSNLQPALAYSADSGVTGGASAWQVFMKRSVKPNYATGPQFAIVPR
ncbi:MAG: hypothetical protein Q7T62_14695 [Undibacterium sp.]|nr:hypothetical protein [Undibacterium sp.]